MPNAGQRVLAADFETSVVSTDSTAQTNITTTEAVGTPEVTATFTAPTSGKVDVTLTMESSDNGGSNTQILDCRVYEDDENGTIVFETGSSTRQLKIRGNNSTTTQLQSRRFLLTGLTAGQIYFLRLYHSNNSGTTGDIAMREVIVVPLVG